MSLCAYQVVRETSTSNSISAEPIEIPPPRPKRKPSHPYPRKLVLPSRKEMPMEHQARSTSPNSSFSEQDNHSPASVMSFVASDTIASADSATPKSSLSPISSGNFADQVAVMPCENNASQGGLLLPNSLPIAPSSVVLIHSLFLLQIVCCKAVVRRFYSNIYWICRNWSFFRTRSHPRRKM